MSEEQRDRSEAELGTQIEAAERRLREATEAAAAAEERATAEIRALEADLEREREARERAIAAAESRLAEIEAQAGAAERRVEEAERRAAAAEGTHGDVEARAREAAAAWLRRQVETLRREASR
jgi:hypothetical protein